MTRPPIDFPSVFEAEWQEIELRRTEQKPSTPPATAPRDLTGLALSGGGIRSATFCLGVLQGLAKQGALDAFDYLSTVSGGGFVGGWWSAWLQRRKKGITDLFPVESLDSRLQNSANPIRHLRLFSNYLTPRKGALSGDTWRAITVVTRNLLLTWLALIPILVGVVLAAQLYFVIDREQVASFFNCASHVTTPSDAKPTSVNTEKATVNFVGDTPICSAYQLGDGWGFKMVATRAPSSESTRIGTRDSSSMPLVLHPIRKRVVRMILPLLIVALWLLLTTTFWMVCVSAGSGTGDFWRGLLTIGSFAAILSMLWKLWRQLALSPSPIVSEIRSQVGEDHWFWFIALAGILVILGYVGHYRLAKMEVVKNRLTWVQSVLLVAFVVTGCVLFFGGFSHEIFLSAESHWIPEYVSRVGGWTAVAVALAGTIYTAFRAAPSGGGEKRFDQPGTVTTIAYAVTPVIVLIVLMLSIATATRALLDHLKPTYVATLAALQVSLIVAVALNGAISIYETIVDLGRPLKGSLIVTCLFVWSYDVSRAMTILFPRGIWVPAIGCIAVAILAWTLPTMSRQYRWIRRMGVFAYILGLLVVWFVVALSAIHFESKPQTGLLAPGMNEIPIGLLLTGMVFGAALIILSFWLPHRDNSRVLGLQTISIVTLATTLMLQLWRSNNVEVWLPVSAVLLIGIAFSLVVGLGWMSDTNQLALHAFYRDRLVRAYLGASNRNRLRRNRVSNGKRVRKEITEADESDDIFLTDVIKCDEARPFHKAGPYHLINTTLNLVGGSDLGTAQRSAESFVLSPLHCGSMRTGFRRTAEYMGGSLTLGTALAISGAAASPNMGSKSPSAALAMLLALLNVRLGFWAPTPNQDSWKSRQPVIWPFYLLSEFLSQTSDLSSFCYLTDGGHFDNTGLYPLIQRGCKRIVLVDCGADPKPAFGDLGEAIRRCYIDFQTLIELDLDAFNRDDGIRYSKRHFEVGRISYSRKHLEALRHPSPEDCIGKIVWIKPSLQPDDPADVLQYALENEGFPQQPTSDQWFDEAQFESYRRLGETCAAALRK